jgi:ribosome-binding factor A
MNTRRQRQVAELLHEEIGTLIQRRARDPRLSAVTVTGVEVSPDLENAWIYVSVLGTDGEIKEALAGLKRATPFLRREIASSLSLRLVPQLIFRLDESVARGIRIDQLLDDIQSTEPHESPDAE